ncbi:aromatic ring-hydroxylating oxygenase subunit alpha [Bordetella petrii]|uniref:aromatic ring-hydroxylating oxygenase subunit alpha n=1 Tax=Bordetella petrii TaxID=94624 RepID=UPI001A96F041|nr:aromatic ring-hydroxylating dioxygenase subunit alpha [Bordetella petrii]MBO1113047.1 aromatic ring-hydroxylating dioxygenase subunit alpha [Bordetella petrii]
MSGKTYEHYVDLKKGLVSREMFFQESVYRDELEKLFPRVWQFVGHESQIPNAGDYFVSRMGEESVILCRDKKQQIHVFLNSCRHRGMKVCLYDEGNTSLFTCPYHAWSYTLDGKLQGVPMYKTIYEGCMEKADWGLIEPPNICNYKGTIWANWDPEAPDFLTYLGDAKEHLDLALDCRDGREGGSEVFGGITKWIIPCNWKFPAENFMGDTYHNVSHKSVDLIGIGPSAKADVKGRRDNELEHAKHLWINFPQGHGVHSAIMPEGQEYVESFKDNPEVEAYFRHCFEERRRRLGDKSRLRPFVGTIFPNTSFHGNQPRSIFVWHPHGPDTVEVWRFFLVDKDAPPAVKDFLRHYYMRYSGPAGMTEQDDMENWNYATAASRGTIARRYPYNYQQSLGKSAINDPVPGNVSLQVGEENPRALYNRWRDYMEGKGWDDLLGKNDPMYRPAQS